MAHPKCSCSLALILAVCGARSANGLLNRHSLELLRPPNDDGNFTRTSGPSGGSSGMQAIWKMQVKTCVHIKSLYSTRFQAYEGCLDLLLTMCPGEDNITDVDSGQTPAGQGFCRTSFGFIRDAVKEHAEDCVALEGGKRKDCEPFMNDLCEPFECEKTLNSTSVSLSCAKRGHKLMDRKSNLAYCTRYKLAQVAQAATKAAKKATEAAEKAKEEAKKAKTEAAKKAAEAAEKAKEEAKKAKTEAAKKVTEAANKAKEEAKKAKAEAAKKLRNFTRTPDKEESSVMQKFWKMQIKTCFHIKSLYSTKFQAYEGCLDLLLTWCHPGEDMNKTGDQGESPTQGFCRTSFDLIRDAVKEHAEECVALKEGKLEDCEPFMKDLCEPFDCKKTVNSKGVSLSCARNDHNLMNRKSNLAYCTRYKVAQVAEAAKKRAKELR